VQQNKLIELQPEAVRTRVGSVWGTFVTYGINPTYVTGHIEGTSSRLRTTIPRHFIIKAPEGYSISEYRLYKLTRKGNRREIRMFAAGLSGATNDIEKHALPFNADRIDKSTWQIRLEMDKGEYGFESAQPHRASNLDGKSGQDSVTGQLYTFGVD
jgi:hypothetical protein